MRAIFDQGDAVLVSQLAKGFHRRRVAEQVRDNDRFGAIADCIFDACRIKITRRGIDVSKDGDRRLIKDRRDRAHIGDRRRDDLVARFRVDSCDCRVDCRGAR